MRAHHLPAQFSIPVGGVALGKVAGTLLELGEWVLYMLLSFRIRGAYKEANKSGDGILDYDDMRLAIQKAQGQEIDPKSFLAAVKEFDAFESHEISHGTFTAIYLKVDKDEMQDVRATDRAKVCSLLVIGWLTLGMFYFSKAEGWSACHASNAVCMHDGSTDTAFTQNSQRGGDVLWYRNAYNNRLWRLHPDHAVRAPCLHAHVRIVLCADTRLMPCHVACLQCR